LFVAVALLTAPAGAGADEARIGAEANPADLRDPFAYLVNPGLGEVTADRLAVGYRLLHLGVVEKASDLGTAGVAYAGRRSFGGLSAGLSVLRSPLSREYIAGAGYGRYLGAGFILGAGAGLYQRSFRPAGFVVESDTDPLLQGQLTSSVPTLSVGGTWWRPDLGLTLAAVLENPHEPDASLAGDGSAPLRRTWRFGAGWEGDAWQLAGSVARDDWRTRWSVLGRGFVLGAHALGFRVGGTDWRVTARFAVGDRFWLEYGVGFPWSGIAGESSGTHGLVLCWRQPTRPSPRGAAEVGAAETAAQTGAEAVPESTEEPGTEIGPAGETGPGSESSPEIGVGAAGIIGAPPPAESGFEVRAPSDSVFVRVKRLRREFAPEAPRARLSHLPLWKAGVLDSTWSENVTWSPTIAEPSMAPGAEKPLGEYSGGYQTQVRQLAAWLREHPSEDVVVAAPAAQLPRARYLARRIARAAGRQEDPPSGVVIQLLPVGASPSLMRPVGNDSLPEREEIVLREYDPLPFAVRRIGTGGVPTTSWYLEIRDARGREIRRIEGSGTPPAVVDWDWRDKIGRRVREAAVTYRWGWTEADGGTYTTPERSLQVVWEIRQRTLRFGREIAPADRAVLRPRLLLGEHPTLWLEERSAPAGEPRNETEPVRERRTDDSKQGAGE
jgi:hypothetical protein